MSLIVSSRGLSLTCALHCSRTIKSTARISRVLLARKYSNLTDSSPDPAIKSVRISTCGELYRKWSTQNKAYSNVPKNGLEFKVDYVDIGSNSKQPVVLALHGAPGSHEDYRPLIDHLSQSGVRMIVPNLPGYEATVNSKGLFRQTAEERTEYVKDFLKAVNVKDIDMVVAHSSATYPAVRLREDKVNFKVKSLTLLNCPGHERMNVLKPAWFIDNYAKFYMNPSGRKIVRALAPFFLKFQTSSVETNMDNLEERMLSTTVMMNSGNHTLPGQLRQLRKENVPLLFVFSDNDRLIQKKMFYDMCEILEAKGDHIRRYDSDGKLLKDWKDESTFKVMSFESGGHYCFLKYAEEVNDAIGKLLAQVTSSSV
ncbi:hypothetical protein HDE_01133 [Halotydeus destructor]|nr:hypothetical protein HDE_01133 [Halotydeus destructor]